ncbi:hypothetical protein SAMN05216267_105237 [Actinacidiphila rubida]|uniref:Uncharacterized protein n=2 Tax=Actinacidiphila rubida TaxID=310780 RepID=A0A1H8TGT7_9ACTN|nr:hypothetical protein SAMN05216267_105237 [Actinacidiphila rubida]
MFGTSGYPHAKIGVVYRFSFPLLKNVSKAPVALTGFKVLSVPGQVQVRGYTVSSVNDTPGYLLGGLDTDFTKYPDYAKKTLIIKPGATSPYYAGVRVQASGKLAHHIKGCDITYQQNDHTYHQVLPCEYALDVT